MGNLLALSAAATFLTVAASVCGAFVLIAAVCALFARTGREKGGERERKKRGKK